MISPTFKFAIVSPLVKDTHYNLLLWLKNSVLSIKLDKMLDIEVNSTQTANREQNLPTSISTKKWKVCDEGTYTLLDWKENSFIVKLSGSVVSGVYSFTEGKFTSDDKKRMIAKEKYKLTTDIKAIKNTILKKTVKKTNGNPVSNIQQLTMDLNKKNKKLLELNRYKSINTTNLKRGRQQWLVTKVKN